VNIIGSEGEGNSRPVLMGFCGEAEIKNTGLRVAVSGRDKPEHILIPVIN
jgi:hypothetical protein